ncbi:hypothetical protein CC79DRAFT_1332275 [Sarocladium strictum]
MLLCVASLSVTGSLMSGLVCFHSVGPVDDQDQDPEAGHDQCEPRAPVLPSLTVE